MEAVAAHWDEVWIDTTVQAPHDTVLHSIRSLGIRSVLEVGSGSGRDLQELKADLDVTYSDFSQVAVDAFRRRNPGTPAFSADARELPFPDGSFDLVLSLGLLEHFDVADRTAILREKFRVARRYVLIDVPQKYSAAFLIKKAMMRAGRWRYGEETEFSYGTLVEEVLRAAPGARIVSSYGRDIFPLPRNKKQIIYSRVPAPVRNAFIRSHSFAARGLAGSLGIVFEKDATGGRPAVA